MSVTLNINSPPLYNIPRFPGDIPGCPIHGAAPRAENITLEKPDVHPLANSWDMYCHLPHTTEWTLSSYKVICSGISTVEQLVQFHDYIPETILKYTMLFVMRAGVKPMWEDPANRDGGSFSFKVLNKNVAEIWYNVLYALAGETLMRCPAHSKLVTGITISPKKNFCILKIWLTNCAHQNVDIIADIPGLYKQKCLFRQHGHE